MVKTLIFLLFALPQISWSLDYTVRITETANSGKTLIIDRGFNDKVVENDYGILIVKVGMENDRGEIIQYVYKPAAKIKSIKINPGSSIWVVHKNFLPKAIHEGAKLMLLSQSALLQGRKELVIDRETIVDEKLLIPKTIKEHIEEDGDFLAAKAKDYDTDSRILHDQEKYFDADFTQVDIAEYKEGLPGQKRFEGIYKSPHAEEFKEDVRVKQFEKMVAMFLKKHNDEEFSKRGLYESQERDPSIPSFPKQTLNKSLYGQIKEDTFIDKSQKRKRYEDLMSQGENWSDGYSDEELSELLYDVGVVREKTRREFIGAQYFDYQGYASFGLNLINNENTGDRANTEQSKWDIEGAVEWYLLKRIEELKRFSVELSFRRSRDAATTGDYNAISTEYSAGFQLNWYPFIPPNALETNIPYFGVLFRYGYARKEIDSLNEIGDYQVVSFPGLKAGLKYNFKNRYGARISAGLENILSDRLARSSDGGELPDRISHIEGKISVGLSRFF